MFGPLSASLFAQTEEVAAAGPAIRARIDSLDWVVIALYAFGMLAVGWYYGRKSETSDDYMLGGRNMSPLSVGLSLFASLLSTLTYLAVPGEMIKYGPMLLAQLAGLPFVALVVGWVLIPIFMKTPFTSAYELLEGRLGLSVRLLGSSFFLLLRLFWMSLVIFATADVVLRPILGLGVTAVPWICTILGVVTVIYTSWGGLRAVVVTDVVQTAILFLGAILVLVLITWEMGGVGAWWPRQWPSNWQEPVFWYDPNVRFTFVGAAVAFFTWMICTAGADQVAIQRFKATRDVRAARRMYFYSIAAEIVIIPFLGIVGIALLAYYQTHGDWLPAGKTALECADDLLPNYIVRGLYPGISGLVIAGLLAAAMSSLSSGLNSACSVIVSDFIDRFHGTGRSEKANVRIAQAVSLIVGATVVALGVLVSQVEGNLLELCYKIANLLTAPLFVLFFMALFVRWATPLGTYVGALYAVLYAVAVGYWQVWGLGFVWLLQVSLAMGIATGCLASLLPFGRRNRASP